LDAASRAKNARAASRASVVASDASDEGACAIANE
jgi:hypothetical protein